MNIMNNLFRDIFGKKGKMTLNDKYDLMHGAGIVSQSNDALVYSWRNY